LLEEVKSTSHLNNRKKASENYAFIYDDLMDSYYLLSTQGKENERIAADKALWYSELNKSRVFTTSWGRTFIDVLRHQLPAELQERERTLSIRHNALQNELEQSMSGQSHQAASEIREQLQKVAKEQSTLEQELRKANPAYGQAAYPQPFAIPDLPLHPGEIFVEFKMLEESLLVWMVQGSPSGSQLIAFYKVDRSRKWFEERILQIRDAFNRGQLDLFDPRICEELFNNLFPEPFVQYVIAAKSIIFVPDDILFLLPFEMLSPHASQTQFILLKTPTTYFPSAAALRLSRTIVRGKREWPVQFLGIADPVTSADDERYIATSVLSGPELARPESPIARASLPLRGQLSIEGLKTRGYIFDRLPNTAIEVSNIASLFPGVAQIRTGIDAKKQQLLQTDLERFRFIHFATHGFFPVIPGVSEPAIVLSYDGQAEDRMMLTLSEVLQLKLHPEMVVLSACNTGSGKVTRSEGVSSMGTAFLAAGASSVTMSLWKVADKSTAILMQEFYKNILSGTSKAASLAAARSALVSRGYSNPFYWAPFVLTGD
jgi:CHAT domain-containing protein